MTGTCDTQIRCKTWEFAAIQEMNTHALQITNHNCGDPPESWNCDGNGDPLIKSLGDKA